MIVNGVDEAELTTGKEWRLPPTDSSSAYVGTLYGMGPKAALHALSNLVGTAQSTVRRLVDVRLVGSMWLEGFEAPAGIRIVE